MSRLEAPKPAELGCFQQEYFNSDNARPGNGVRCGQNGSNSRPLRTLEGVERPLTSFSGSGIGAVWLRGAEIC